MEYRVVEKNEETSALFSVVYVLNDVTRFAKSVNYFRAPRVLLDNAVIDRFGDRTTIFSDDRLTYGELLGLYDDMTKRSVNGCGPKVTAFFAEFLTDAGLLIKMDGLEDIIDKKLLDQLGFRDNNSLRTVSLKSKEIGSLSSKNATNMDAFELYNRLIELDVERQEADNDGLALLGAYLEAKGFISEDQ